MKKLLLLAAAALLSGASASAATWAVVGAYCDWKFENATHLTGSGNNLSCTIDNLTNSFKIVDIDDASWAIQYGTSAPLEINTPVVLQGKNGGADPANITFAGLIQAVNNATVKWNPSTFTLEIDAQQSDLEIAYPTLYVTGNFNNLDWPAPGDEGSVLCTESNGIYTATFDLGTSGNVEFKLAGTGWSNEIAGGATVTADAAASVEKGGGNLKTTLTGNQTLTFNYNTMAMTFGDPSLVKEAVKQTWAVVGTYTNPQWNFAASTTFTGDDDNLSCTINNFSGEFKIVNITNDNWDIQFGGPTNLFVNTDYTIDQGGNNMTVDFFYESLTRATFNWNPSSKTLEIKANESDINYTFPTLYITGDFNGLDWPTPGNTGTIEMNQNDGVYTAEMDLGSDTDSTVQFKLSVSGWGKEVSGGMEIGVEPTKVALSGGDLYTSLKGKRTLTFNAKTLEMNFSDITDGVEGIEAEADAAPVYYNLQGMKVENPANGIFIVKKGNTTSKTIIR